MKKLPPLILLTPFIKSNPAGSWREDMYDSSYSYGDGIWPYLLIGFVSIVIYGFIANWYDEYREKQTNKVKHSQDNINKLEQEAKNLSISEPGIDLTDLQKKAWQKRFNTVKKKVTHIYLNISQ